MFFIFTILARRFENCRANFCYLFLCDANAHSGVLLIYRLSRIILINILILLFIVKKKLLLNFIEYLDENDILKINNLNNNNNGNNNNGNNNNVNNKNYLVNNKNNNVLKNNNLFNSLSNFDKTLYRNNFNGNNKKLFEKYLFLKKKLNQLKNDNYGERNYDKKISIIEDKIKNTIQLLLKK